MADGHFPTLVSKNRDANSQTNPIFHALTDGTDLLLVNADGSLNAIVTATDLDIRDLTHVSDSVKVGDGTDFLAINADGSINITDNGGSLTVDAIDLDIRNLTLAQDAVQISANGSANSQTNPIFVQLANNVQSGEVHDPNTASAVVADATSNHSYTVVNTFKLMKITVASSGACKFEVQVGPVASLVSKRWGFIPHNGGYEELTFNPPIEVSNASTGTIRIIRTNRENQAQDLYSSIEGIDN